MVFALLFPRDFWASTQYPSVRYNNNNSGISGIMPAITRLKWSISKFCLYEGISVKAGENIFSLTAC